MCGYPTPGKESDQVEKHFITSLSTPAVSNVLLIQDTKFHFSLHISRVRCHDIRDGRKRDTGRDSCPHQDHIILTKKRKGKAYLRLRKQ